MEKIIKIKNPSLSFQRDLRYRVTKELKTVIHCRLVEFVDGVYKDVHYGKDYKGVLKRDVLFL